LKQSTDLTVGSVTKVLLRFALPFLFSNFMQAFYGAVDMFVVGKFCTVSALSAVTIGSQVMHIVTAFIIGISMGLTIRTANAIGSQDIKKAADYVGCSIILFAIITVILTPIMVTQAENITMLMNTPTAAIDETVQYIKICALGLPFIVAFNVIASILRGLGNSRTPMYFVGIACVVNVVGDLLLTGVFGFGVAGAAFATSAAQLASSICGFIYLAKHRLPFAFSRKDIRLQKSSVKGILSSGFPIAMQDTLVSISFIFLTVIANGRGLVASSAVGVAEKIVIFMFLVPAAMLSAISAITAQNIGAGKSGRAIHTMKKGIVITSLFGVFMCAISWIIPETLTGIFSNDAEVIVAAGEYLRTYSIDCIAAAFVFCINGYLCGTNRSLIASVHSIIAIFLGRVPAAYLLSNAFPSSLLPMGLASAIGSLVSLIILGVYFLIKRRKSRLA